MPKNRQKLHEKLLPVCYQMCFLAHQGAPLRIREGTGGNHNEIKPAPQRRGRQEKGREKIQPSGCKDTDEGQNLLPFLC